MRDIKFDIMPVNDDVVLAACSVFGVVSAPNCTCGAVTVVVVVDDILVDVVDDGCGGYMVIRGLSFFLLVKDHSQH